jgi:hypothetical protein
MSSTSCSGKYNHFKSAAHFYASRKNLCASSHCGLRLAQSMVLCTSWIEEFAVHASQMVLAIVHNYWTQIFGTLVLCTA